MQGAAQFADFNHGGKAHLIYQGLDNTFWLLTSNGGSFNDPVAVAKLPGTFEAGQAQYGNLNGELHPDPVF